MRSLIKIGLGVQEDISHLKHIVEAAQRTTEDDD